MRARFFWNKETCTWDDRRPDLEPKETSANIQVDEIPPTEYMGNANREIYTSYAKLKRRCKEDGFEITGGEHLKNVGKVEPEYGLPKSSPEEIREMTEKAYYDIKYGRVPVTEKERERWNQEERAYKAELRRRKTRWA